VKIRLIFDLLTAETAYCSPELLFASHHQRYILIPTTPIINAVAPSHPTPLLHPSIITFTPRLRGLRIRA
jgi:hypothetical protein